MGCELTGEGSRVAPLPLPPWAVRLFANGETLLPVGLPLDSPYGGGALRPLGGNHSTPGSDPATARGGRGLVLREMMSLVLRDMTGGLACGLRERERTFEFPEFDSCDPDRKGAACVVVATACSYWGGSREYFMGLIDLYPEAWGRRRLATTF